MSPDMLVVLALVLGSVRALGLWRAQARVDAINVAVVSTLVEGRARDLPKILGGAGTGLYPAVAQAIAEPVEKLFEGERVELKRRLERDARRALALAHRSLGRFAWLESLSLVAIVLAGVWAFGRQTSSFAGLVGLFAASVLWFANTRGARSIATQLVAGGMALVDTLLESVEHIRERAPSVDSR